MLFHLVEQKEMLCTVQKHAAHYFREDVLGCACESGVVEQMTGTLFWGSEERVGQPASNGCLIKTRLSLQELYAMQDAAKLVLPSATSGEELLEDESAIAYCGLVPSEMAEIAERTQDGGCKNATCAKA